MPSGYGEKSMPLHYGMLRASVHVAGPAPGGSEEGTGFFITVRSESIPGKRHGYLITAHHVIDGLQDVYIQAVNAHTGDLYRPFLVEDWRQPLPGVDLALAPIPGTHGDYTAVEMEVSLMPTERIAAPQLGAQIYYVGLFQPARCLMARSGNLGAHNVTSVDRYPYPVHLLDCRSYGGFSGSPCWAILSFAGLEPTTIQLDPPPGIEWPEVGGMHHVAMLCGMFVAHYSDEEDEDYNPEGVVSRYGVGIMIRGQEIWAALMTDEMKAERRRWDEEESRD